jgi:hypothetical protein
MKKYSKWDRPIKVEQEERFEIPLEPRTYNLFTTDDYLRSIRTSEGRKKLIQEVGFSAEARWTYEQEHGLPRGAVELAMMAEDPRVKEMSERFSAQVTKSTKEQLSPEEAKKFYMEVDSMMSGLRALYPEAIQFAKEYGMLSQRNKTSFRGDYQFSNEAKILLSNTCPGPPPDPCNPDAWWCTTVYVYTWSLVAAWIFLAVALSLVAALFVAAVVWVLICFAAPVQWPPCGL